MNRPGARTETIFGKRPTPAAAQVSEANVAARRGGWRRPPASKRRLCGERGRAFRDSQNRAASERSDRVERAPGRAPEDEFLCKGGAPPVSQLGNCDLQVAGLSAQAAKRPRGGVGARPNLFSWCFATVVFRLLFLEAMQLKTAPTGRFAGLSGEKAVVEAQVAGIGTRKRRRPAVPVVANEPQRTACLVVAAVAEARGCRAAPSRRLGVASAARLEEAAVCGERRLVVFRAGACEACRSKHQSSGAERHRAFAGRSSGPSSGDSGSTQQFLSARQRNLIQTRTLRLNDFAT